jgi:hypothetical protein
LDQRQAGGHSPTCHNLSAESNTADSGSQNGRKLVKFEGAETIQELQRIATSIQERSKMGSTPEIASR